MDIGGTADGEEEQGKEGPRNQGPEQSTGAILKNMYLLQLGMWVFLLCMCERQGQRHSCSMYEFLKK